MVLHLDVQSNTIFKHKPEVASLVLQILGISISKIVFTFNLLSEELFFLCDTKDIVIFDNLCLSKSSLANIVSVYSDHAVVGGEAEFSVASDDSYFVVINVKHLVAENAHVVILYNLLPLCEIWENPHRICPLPPKKSSWWILKEHCK